MPEGWRVWQPEVRTDRLTVGGCRQRYACAPIVQCLDRRVIGRQLGLIGGELGDLDGRRVTQRRGGPGSSTGVGWLGGSGGRGSRVLPGAFMRAKLLGRTGRGNGANGSRSSRQRPD